MGLELSHVFHDFQALGTQFHVELRTSAPEKAPWIWLELEGMTEQFDSGFSRFIADSEVNRWRYAVAGRYQISNLLAELLEHADRLRTLTGGKFDPAVASVLEDAGYDAHYSFSGSSGYQDRLLSHWEVHRRPNRINISGPIVFDLGGFGKGYWIDELGNYLLTQGVQHWLVDGGGDMAASSKSASSGYTVALEWPGKPDTAIGTIELLNQGFAASDIFKRRWGNKHHIMDIMQRKSTTHVLGAFAVAKNAMTADMMTSALMLCAPEKYSRIARELGGEYLAVLADNTIRVSGGWPGEVFAAKSTIVIEQ